eukprot:1191824-Prorocentrum_minimum.AAC.2
MAREDPSTRRYYDYIVSGLLFMAIIGGNVPAADLPNGCMLDVQSRFSGVVFYARTNALKQRQADVLASASNVAAAYNR